ncbi:hypothetical protein [Alcanivorax sp.]|uniref:hypothetical protein n=1 Tax=Alcanivorax sp. TaxID=1872427 RepID=UPI0025BA5B88|nr:hypothetical protein [Alcanivorax sp.]
MTKVSVLFEVPDEIATGLMDGSLERVGGVIRRSGDKKVRAWLREGMGELQNDAPGDDLLGGGIPGSQKGPGLPDVIANQQLMMGLQVANLAVSAAGFAVIYHKLNRVEGILNGVDSKLNNLRHDMAWLDKKQLLSEIAPMAGAMKALNAARDIKDEGVFKGKLIDADGRLDTAKEYFYGVIGRMLAEELECIRPEEFAACYRAWLMANQGAIDVMLALDEGVAARSRLEILKKDHAMLGNSLKESRIDVGRRVRGGRVAQNVDQYLDDLSHQMVGAHDLIKGQALMLEVTQDQKISVRDIDRQIIQPDPGFFFYYIES